MTKESYKLEQLRDELRGVRILLEARNGDIKTLKLENDRLKEENKKYHEEYITLVNQIEKLKCTIKNISELI